MQAMESYWGRRALDFVDAVEASTTSASVVSQFEKMIAEFGFHAYIMAGIPMPGQSIDQTTLANGWPAEWHALYARENMAAVDPIPRHCLSTLNPFLWTDAPYDHEHNRPAHRVMTLARDFRLNQGFCVPIHYDDAAGAVSLGGERPCLDTESKGALHLMSVSTHGRLKALAHSAAVTPSRRLSQVEVDVVSWAARGKTVWETGRILGLTERNVRWHLEEAQRKLMTKNKTSTVATALVNREILL